MFCIDWTYPALSKDFHIPLVHSTEQSAICTLWQ